MSGIFPVKNQQDSMQLLRTIFIILLAYYIIRIMSRYVLPWFATYFLKRTFRNMGKQQPPPTSKKKTGEVDVTYRPKKKEVTKDVGEYIDYEEIEE